MNPAKQVLSVLILSVFGWSAGCVYSSSENPWLKSLMKDDSDASVAGKPMEGSEGASQKDVTQPQEPSGPQVECPSPPGQNDLIPPAASSIPQKPVTRQTYIDFILRQRINKDWLFHQYGFNGNPNQNIYLNGGMPAESNGPGMALQGLALADYYKKKGDLDKAKAYLQKVKYYLLGPGPWNNWANTGDKNYTNNQFKQFFERSILDTGGDGSALIRRCWFVGFRKDQVPFNRPATAWGYQDCKALDQNQLSKDLNDWAAQNEVLNPKIVQLEYKNPKGGYHTSLHQPERIEMEIRALEEAEAAKGDKTILTDEERGLLNDMVFRLNKTIRVWGYGEEVNDYEPRLAWHLYDPAKYPMPAAPHLPPRKDYYRGSHHRAQAEGMMKRLAARRFADDNDPNVKNQAAVWQHYADIVWNDWWSSRDTAFDQTSYTILDWLDYVLLGAHLADQDPTMKTFWDEAGKGMKPFWDRYSNLVTPDGFLFPLSVHEGFTEGEPFLLWQMELLGAKTKDGRYRWAAHRIMNDLLYQEGQGKLSPEATKAHGLIVEGMALAYLLADDGVAPVEPDPRSQSADGKKVFWANPYNESRDLGAKYLGSYDDDLFKNYSDISSPNYDHGHLEAFIVLKGEKAPSKIFFKSGNRPGDLTALVETAARDGSPHNPGGIVGMSSHGSLLAMSQSPKLFTGLQNMLSVEDPSKKVTMVKNENPDAHPWQDLCYMESEAPAFADYRLATHALLKTKNYLCFPMTDEREFFFVKNRFLVVRDRATSHFNKPFDGLLKELWYTETVGAKGDNWADTYVEKPRFGDKYFMANPRWNLLVYHSPREGRVLNIVPTSADLNWLGGTPFMPQAVSYDRKGIVTPETPEVFTQVLLPHDPSDKVKDLVSSIDVPVDTPDQTVIRLGATDNQREWVVLNEKGQGIKTGGLETDAKQLYLDLQDGKVARILAVEASYLALDGKDLFRKDQRITVDGVLPPPECL